MKKNFKKVLFLLIVISTIVSSLFVYAEENYGNVEAKNTWGSQKGNYYGQGSTSEGSISDMGSGQQRVNASGSISGGHAMFIKLVKYNSSSKNEEIVGTPILLYTGGFLDDITNVDAGAGGATLEGGTATMAGATLCFSPSGSCSGGSLPILNHPNGPATLNAFAPVSRELGKFYTGQRTDANGNIYFTYSKAAAIVNGRYYPVDSACTGSTNSVYGPEVTSYYKRKDIKYKFTETSGVVGEGKVTIKYTNVALGSKNLYDYIRKYLVGAVSGFYDENSSILRSSSGIVTIDKLQSAFKASINMVDLNDYYLSFEPAVREITTNVVNSWASTQTSSGVYGESKWNWTCSVNSSLGGCAASINTACQRIDVEEYECNCYDDCDDDLSSNGYRKGNCTSVCQKCHRNVVVRGTWSAGSCCGYRNSYSNTLISMFYEKESIVKPARISIRNDVIQTVTTSTTQVETKHCVLDKENNCTNTYEYFIGPNLKTAITGTTGNNKYYLYNGTQAFNSTSAKNNAVGVSYWWLSDLTSCKHECPNSNDLSCIENYCDNVVGYDERANTQKLKASCMLNFCGYSYTRVNCATANPYRGMHSPNLDTAETSTCSNLNSGLGNTIDNGKTKVTCESDPVGRLNDPNDSNPLNEIFDQKTYINVACKETTAIGFKDISKDKIIPGEGIEYYVNQLGNKECTVFWDTETFKFAYASYHSEDMIKLSNGSIISTRAQLLNMLNYFNGGTTRSINKSIGINLSGEDTNYTWADLKYNKKVNELSNVTEIVNNVKQTSSGYTLVNTYEEENSKLDLIDNKAFTTYNFQSPVNLSAKKYTNISEKTATYTFDKYCISSDGKANVTLAPANGVCYTLNGKEVLGRNVYYTNLNATPTSKIIDKRNEPAVTTVVSDSEGRTMYTDYCPYETEKELECTIDVLPLSGTEAHGNGIYVGGVEAEILVQSKLGKKNKVAETTISAQGNTSSNVLNINISNPNKGEETVTINGTVRTESGNQVTCSRKITILSKACGASCSINEVNKQEGIFELVGVNALSYQSSLSDRFNFVRLAPDITNGKYYIRTVGKNDTRRIYGKVEGRNADGGVCYSMCYSQAPALDNCPSIYKPADLTGIKEYCISSWDTDVNDYNSVEDCKVRCSKNACPRERTDLSKVREYCTNYKNLGYSTESNCVNYCYYNGSDDAYVYRPVNNNYPFPDGTRTTQGKIDNLLIGSNWVDKEHYITDDNDDLTSVTGVYANQTPEYVIDLDKEAIKNIRNYVTNYNDSKEGANAYLDYVYASNTDKNGRYYSAFISNNGINQYFKMIDGKSN